MTSFSACSAVDLQIQHRPGSSQHYVWCCWGVTIFEKHVRCLQAIGKSCFMRLLTKCHFSPSGEGLTTKAPIRLCLVCTPEGSTPHFKVFFRGVSYPLASEAEIAPFVKHIMETQIPPRQLTHDEITVKICKPGIPSLVFIDLPGIRETGDSSKELAKKYIQDPMNLVISWWRLPSARLQPTRLWPWSASMAGQRILCWC